MKRYIFLFTGTAVLVFGLILAGQSLKQSVVRVNTWKLQPVTASCTLQCSGTVERANQKKVAAPQNAVVTEVFVKNGDSVQKGEKLFTISCQQTEQEVFQQSEYLEMWEEYQETGVIPEKAQDLLEASKNADEQAVEGPQQKEGLVTVTSPSNGTVNGLETVTGDSVTAGETILTLADEKEIYANLQVNEAGISNVEIGQEVVLTGVGFSGMSVQGKVANIAEEAVQKTSVSGKETVVEVTVSIDDPSEKIKPGYTVKASITTQHAENTLLIPYSAILADEDGQEYIYMVQEGRAVKQPITTKTEYTNGVSTQESLTKGQGIILNPEQVTEACLVQSVELEEFPDV